MRRSSMKWLVSVVQISALLAAGASYAAAEKVYVADEEGNTVSVIDASSFKRIGSIPVGQGPHNVQVAPDGRQVWVTNNGEPAKAVHNMPKSEHGAMAGTGEIWAIDTTTDAVVAKVPVGMHPAHVVVTPDGRFAYVANGGENTVSVVDISAKRVVDTFRSAPPHTACGSVRTANKPGSPTSRAEPSRSLTRWYERKLCKSLSAEVPRRWVLRPMVGWGSCRCLGKTGSP